MSRKNPDLQKATVNLRYGDMDYLHTVAAGQNIPASILVRNIIAKAVDQMRAKEAPLPKMEIDL